MFGIILALSIFWPPFTADPPVVIGPPGVCQVGEICGDSKPPTEPCDKFDDVIICND